MMDAIATVPYTYIPDGVGQYIQFVQALPLTSRATSKAEIDNELRIKETWELAIHHLIKSWHPKHRIPYPRHLVKATKPLGDLTLAYFQLCLICWHSLPEKTYQNPGIWFSKILYELQRNDFNNLSKYEGKTATIARHREMYSKLYRGENPIISFTSPHEHRLIETARQLLGGNKGGYFDKKYWKPLLIALQKWNTKKQSPEITTVFPYEGKLYCREGRGKAKYLLVP